jgi:glycosyltransferase involved in cell wall biosynthesis
MLTGTENSDEGQIHVLEIAGNAIVGGMEKYVYNMVQSLPPAYFKVTVLTLFESAFTNSLRQLGAEVYITNMDIDPPWRSIQFTTELIRHLKVDLVHAHLPRAHVLGGISARLTGIPAVGTVHGMDITSQELGICRTTGTHLTVVCYEAYSQALALGLPADRLTLIPNGVDLKTYCANRTGISFRKAQHIPPNAPLVGFVGRLAWEKGPDQFVQVAKYVHDQMPDVHFAMVGEGPMEAELAVLIDQAGLADVFHLAGLWTNTWEVYPAFDILAQTSRVEGMPFCLLEGMACGTPVVAMGVGGVAEVVEVGSTGLLSAAGDWAGLGNAIVTLISNPERLKQMTHAARRRAEENFDLQDSIRLMANLFYRLLGRKSPQDIVLPQSSWQVNKPNHPAIPMEPVGSYQNRSET